MFSETCEYAIKAMIFINSNKADARKISLLEVAEAIDSPIAFTAKILQQLRKGGFLLSAIGAKGGYWARKRKKVSLADIVKAIDGDSIFTRCILGLKTCSHLNPCPMHEKYVSIKDSLQKVMGESYLDDFLVDVINKRKSLK